MLKPDRKFILELALKLRKYEKDVRLHDRETSPGGHNDGLEPKEIIRLIREWTECSEEDADVILGEMELLGLGPGRFSPPFDYDCEGFARKLKAELEGK